jgi:hypothetical protein
MAAWFGRFILEPGILAVPVLRPLRAHDQKRGSSFFFFKKKIDVELFT